MIIQDQYTNMPISRSKKWKLRHPEKLKKITSNYYSQQRKLDLLRQYSLTNIELEKLIKSQDNKCAICKKPFITTPYIDHDHKTGKIRGLLCRECNGGIGMFKDNTTLLRNAIHYLK